MGQLRHPLHRETGWLLFSRRQPRPGRSRCGVAPRGHPVSVMAESRPLLYRLLMAVATSSFILGRRSAGSEHEERSTARPSHGWPATWSSTGWPFR